ncbi:MAG: acyl-CoA dehydrogenase family protein [Acidimicrobiia bacterium]
MDTDVLVPDELNEFVASISHQAFDRIAPYAEALDREQRFSEPVWSALRDMGMFALTLPVEAGGAGAPFLAFALATEAIAMVSAAAALYPGTTVQVAGAVLRLGSESQRDIYLPGLLAAERPAAWAFTEPGTGSDPKQLTTTARRDGDGWRLSGQKLFISYARQCSVALVFARTDEGIGAFLVEPAAEGWSTGEPFEVMALGGSEPAPIFLDDLWVPDKALLGGPSGGFDAMIAGEALGKVRASAINLGITRRAIEVASTFALERMHRGEAIGTKFPTIQTHLAEMETVMLGARSLVLDAARLVDAGANVARVAAAARIASGRAAREATNAALQVCGAYGLTRDMIVERLYREAKFFEVAQGAVDLQRVIVARHVLDDARKR